MSSQRATSCLRQTSLFRAEQRGAVPIAKAHSELPALVYLAAAQQLTYRL